MLKPTNQGGLGLNKIKQLFGQDINSIDDFNDLVNDISSSIYSFIIVQ